MQALVPSSARRGPSNFAPVRAEFADVVLQFIERNNITGLNSSEIRLLVNACRVIATQAISPIGGRSMDAICEELGISPWDMRVAREKEVPGRPGENYMSLAGKLTAAIMIGQTPIGDIRTEIIKSLGEEYPKALANMLKIASGEATYQGKPVHPRDQVAAFNAINSSFIATHWMNKLSQSGEVSEDDVVIVSDSEVSSID